jgi:predicted transcriptional regulator
VFEEHDNTTRRRSGIGILVEVLSAIRNGTAKPSHIMYTTNLTYRTAQRTLRTLQQQGLIKGIDVKRGSKSSKLYEITEKGERLFQHFSKVRQLCTIEEII